MTGRFLVTAGPVHAALDDNKVLTNRARGIWAEKFAEHMSSRGHEVVLLRGLDVTEYRKRCLEEAPSLDGAVMAAAVINYVPEKRWPGKMPTDLDHVDVRLVRTPYVIDEMRRANPRMCVIGCKLTSGEPSDSTVGKARHLMERSRCSAVVANDLSDLRVKRLCFRDGAVMTYVLTDAPDVAAQFFFELELTLTDAHYGTVHGDGPPRDPGCEPVMDRLLDRFRSRFSRQDLGGAFGSVAVRGPDGAHLMTPRTKSPDVTARDCVMARVDHARRAVHTDGGKATMNAPLLANALSAVPHAAAVVHLHEQCPGFPTVPYAPPGTRRDSVRPRPPFNIEHHGLVMCVDAAGETLA